MSEAYCAVELLTVSSHSLLSKVGALYSHAPVPVLVNRLFSISRPFPPVKSGLCSLRYAVLLGERQQGLEGHDADQGPCGAGALICIKCATTQQGIDTR
jgi:hypothetical protein